MDDTIACLNISSDNIDGISLITDLNSIVGLDKLNNFTAKCGDTTGSNGSCRDFTTDDMSKNNFLGGLRGQTFQCSGWQFGKSFIGWSQNSHSFDIFECVNQSKIRNDLYQSFEASSIDSHINNIILDDGSSNIDSLCCVVMMMDLSMMVNWGMVMDLGMMLDLWVMVD